MTKRASAAKASKRSAKHSTKKTRTPPEPTAAAESERDQQSHESEPRPAALDSARSLAKRIKAQREQLFKAISIVECCKYASATLYNVYDSEYMVPAFDVICDLLDTSVGELELIASECEDLD
ncbi:hypothetical protein HNQ60_003924 [Povalibacter uvarum]|uniref:Uncharacterized protein n=1 Tax=Povalibacter uvarum TaxID=732238 RepID=A0A841HPF9_9GAMM|nr:hypothetical protein [Povalibacter uvarum]MBB6095037.1 hypothetical protein [Povalibacter uvarum]